MINRHHILLLFIASLFAFSYPANAQTEAVSIEASPADSLSLDSIISKVVST